MVETFAAAGTVPLSTLDWFEGNLARVIGLSAGSSAVVPTAAGGSRNAPALRAFARRLEQRFHKVVDPRSGQVTFETAGELLIPLQEEGDIQPLIGDLAAGYLGAVRTVLGRIDAGLCFANICREEVEGALAQIQATLDVLMTEAPRRGGRVQALMCVDELTNDEFGLLIRLRTALADDPADRRRLDREQALEAIEAALEALHRFEDLLRSPSPEEPRPLADLADTVRRCAPEIAALVRDVQRVLDQAGVSRCALGHIEIYRQTDSFMVGGTALDRLTLPEAFRAIEAEPGRWTLLIEQGVFGGVDAIKGSANLLARILEGIDPETIAGHLQLDTASAERLTDSLRRMTGFATLVIREISGWPHREDARNANSLSTIPAEEGGPIKP